MDVVGSDSDSPQWKKSSHSNSGSCVEVRRSGQWIKIRDSKDPAGPQLNFTEREWIAFLSGARDGEFEWGDVPGR